MKISEVVALTKIAKRTIYFYIHEGLLQPETDPGNGYHDFSASDVQRLQIIAKLRRLDFSLADIRHILRFPSTASYYFYRQMDELGARIEVLQENVQRIAGFFEQEGPSIDQAALLANLQRLEDFSPPHTAHTEFTERDAKLIPLFIWAPYLTSPMSEYQEFIWAKISKRLTAEYLPFLRNMKRIISAIRPERLQYSADLMSRQVADITALQADTLEAYARQMLADIRDFLDDPVLVRKWNLVYPVLIDPLLTIGYSEIRNMMFQQNETYKQFYDHVSVLCSLLWHWLCATEEGRATAACIRARLTPIDWEAHGRGELERMACFSFSPYALLKQDQLETILLQTPGG